MDRSQASALAAAAREDLAAIRAQVRALPRSPVRALLLRLLSEQRDEIEKRYLAALSRALPRVRVENFETAVWAVYVGDQIVGVAPFGAREQVERLAEELERVPRAQHPKPETVYLYDLAERLQARDAELKSRLQVQKATDERLRTAENEVLDLRLALAEARFGKMRVDRQGRVSRGGRPVPNEEARSYLTTRFPDLLTPPQGAKLSHRSMDADGGPLYWFKAFQRLIGRPEWSQASGRGRTAEAEAA